MTSPSGPRRLKDDPDFRWETGCDLTDEASVVGGYDLTSARAGVMARIAAGAAPAPAPVSGLLALIKPWLGALAVLGAVGAGYFAGIRAATPAPTLVAAPSAVEQVTSESPIDPSPARPPDAVPASPLPEPSSPPVSAPAALSRPARAPGPGSVGVAATTPPSDAGAPTSGSLEFLAPGASPPAEIAARPQPDPALDGLSSKGPRSRLEQQLSMYDQAVTALEQGKPADAREGFLRYLSTWPNGDLRPEAQLGLLQALHGTGDASGAELLALEIQELPEFAGRRPQVLRLRAESLVILGRCDEAVVVVEALSPRDGAEVRKACRSMRREGP